MSISLSRDTQRLIDVLFEEDHALHIKRRIEEDVSENIPFCEKNSPKSMERIRFSVIRLLSEKRMDEDAVFELANVDWRDLFMAAGHGDVDAHKAWAKSAIRDAGPTGQ